MGRELLKRLARHSEGFAHLERTVQLAIELEEATKGRPVAEEVRKLLSADSVAAAGAELLREFRNGIVHGDIVGPLPVDWGRGSNYRAGDDPVILQFHLNTRLTLMLIQILMLSVVHDGNRIKAWLSERIPAHLLLTRLHLNAPELWEIADEQFDEQIVGTA